jgi:hypothetical protein
MVQEDKNNIKIWLKKTKKQNIWELDPFSPRDLIKFIFPVIPS